MIIKYTTVLDSRFDAPFVGTLISGCYCYGNCGGCFNQHIKSMEHKSIDADELLDSIESNPFSQGIILGGLEWLDSQADQAIYLIENSLKRGLKAILYTRRDQQFLKNYYPELFDYKGLYIKVGEYDRTKRSTDYTSYGVPLSTTNQYIIEVE